MKDLNKDALTYAFNLLSISDRSEKILFEKLTKRFDESASKDVIAYLKSNNFINDDKYAGNLINNYQTLRHFGKNRIKVELIKKKIPSDIISKQMENIVGEEAGCIEATKNWMRKKSVSGEMDYATKTKLISFLMRRGYDYEISKQSIDNLLNNCN